MFIERVRLRYCSCCNSRPPRSYGSEDIDNALRLCVEPARRLRVRSRSRQSPTGCTRWQLAIACSRACRGTAPRRQDLPRAPCSQRRYLCWCASPDWRQDWAFVTEGTVGYEMPESRSVDIDIGVPISSWPSAYSLETDHEQISTPKDRSRAARARAGQRGEDRPAARDPLLLALCGSEPAAELRGRVRAHLEQPEVDRIMRSTRTRFATPAASPEQAGEHRSGRARPAALRELCGSSP